MKMLKQEPDEFIQATVNFMLKLDKNRRDEVFSYARFLNHQKELEQKENHHLHLVNSGGRV